MIKTTTKNTVAPSRRGRPSRLDAVLEEATRQFNARGVSGAQLSKVADNVGLTRVTLYHYFTDREDLVYRCYLRACAIVAGNIESAHTEGRNGLESVLAYVAEALNPRAGPVSVISDTDYLEPAHRSQIEQAHRRNLAGIQSMIIAGQDDGSIRQCDSAIAAQLIFGIHTWLSLAPNWLANAENEFLQADSVAALLSDGIAADPLLPIDLRHSFTLQEAQPKSSFDRNYAKEAKRQELVATASRLFNRKSIDGTSVEDIAAELGTTTGAVYHYFKTKGALVFACYDRAYDIYNQQAEMAAAVGETGLQRLLYTIRFAIESAELAPLVVFTGAEQLPSKGRRRIVNRLRELVDRAVGFYREGEVDGSLRSLPALSTVLALGGSVQRASQWHTLGSLQDQRSAADQILTLFASGLRRRP